MSEMRGSVVLSTRHLVLVGLMGSGKTTVGRSLAARLGRPFVDNDLALLERTGRTAREIADAEGADALHRHEAEALVDALGKPEPAVVAAAAAAPFEPITAPALRAQAVVYLRASPAVLAARLARAAATDQHRPFVGDPIAGDPIAGDNARAVLDEQFEQRDAGYRELATLTVDADADGRYEAVVDEISAALARRAPRTRRGS
jgi:shikimate kinase